MSSMKILINASNLHVGGGVQVASSFIFELSLLLSYEFKEIDISVLCSDSVFANLPKDFNKNVFNNFIIYNIRGVKQPELKIKKLFSYYDICFTVFGPLYFKPEVRLHICGFAQAWIAYPNNIAYKNLNVREYVFNKIKFYLQSIFFRQCDYLIVEQKHIKYALCKLDYKKKKISVVSNCVSSIFDDKSSWLPVLVDDFVEDITLGFIGRPYSHKNVQILSSVNDILLSKYKMRCNFLFTFTESEMQYCGFSNIDNFHSTGAIKISQCPSFFEKLDALIFPSLLECFSVSPLEAMKMNVTVIASNYPFVYEVCGDSAYYFNPLSAENIAKCIYEAFSNRILREQKIKSGQDRVRCFPTARERAVSYLNIIINSI